VASTIVSPDLIDRTYATLEASSERDRLLEQAFDNSELVQRIHEQLSANEGANTREAILTLCKTAFVLGWRCAFTARQLAIGGGK